MQREKQKAERLAAQAPKAAGEERIMLTPDMAIELIEHNTHNRPISDGHVQRIAKQIVDGKWRFNGDTIKIADSGDVLDGQHRLWAAIEAKTPIETLIVYGIAKEAFSTIDTIRRHRSGGDTLSLNGASRHRNIAASSLRWLLRWHRGVLPEYRAPQNRIENSDIQEAWAAHPAIVNAVERAMRLRSLANPSVLSFLYYVLSNRNADLAERMMETLENPASVSVTDPFYKFREYLLADHYKRKEPLYTIALAIKSANSAHEGKPVSNLRWNNQGSRAELFPELAV